MNGTERPRRPPLRQDPRDTRIAKAVIGISIATMAIPMLAVLWLFTSASSALPAPTGLGMGAWPAAVDPRSLVAMLLALALLLGSALIPALMSGLARDLAAKLYAQGADMLAGSLVAARAVARSSVLATLIVAAVFLAAAAVHAGGAPEEEPDAIGEAPDRVGARPVDPAAPGEPTSTPRPPQLVFDAGAPPAQSSPITEAERRASVEHLATATMSLVPVVETLRDSVGPEGIRAEERACGSEDVPMSTFDVSVVFRTGGAAVDPEPVRALFAERGLDVDSSASEITGAADLESDPALSYANLYYDTDGVFILIVSGACGPV